MMTDSFDNSDSGINTCSNADNNTYTIEDYRQLIEPLLNSVANKYLDKHIALRSLLDFSLSHGLLMKSLQKRETKISDLCTFPICASPKPKSTNLNCSLSNSPQNTTTTSLITTALVIRGSLPNYPTQYYGCLRHKSVECCTHLAVAMYLFSRFHITDEYGSTELNGDFVHDPLFHETRLLKGSNRFHSMSYSQQHKAASKALKIAGFDGSKVINLGKFLASSQHDAGNFTKVENLSQFINTNDKPVLININNLPEETLFQMAGFESKTTYYIERDTFEPPEELLRQIFPFINDDHESKFKKANAIFPIKDGLDEIFSIRLKEVLKTLRRSLIQDMALIKIKYPSNILSQHPIFNSQLFDDFANQYLVAGFVTPGDAPVSSRSSLTSFDSLHVTPRPSLSQDNLGDEFLSRQLQDIIQYQIHQELVIKQLQKQLNCHQEQQTILQNDLQNFIKQQNEVFQKQSEYLQKVQNTTNGLSVLMASKLPQSISHIQHNLINNSNTLACLNNNSIQQGLANTVELLTKLNTNQQNFVTINNNSNVYNHPSTRGVQDDKSTLERKKVLNKRLSRQAITLYEMWEDFKSLEKDLKNHEISITEWLKVHGSSERQFRHTRMKIIRFVEEEAERRNCHIDIIKEALHQKMRNRNRPWTLDEVQRMLTAGKRISLD